MSLSNHRGVERGAVPIELALGAGVLVLPVAIMVLTFPTWVERQSMARLAAREAARTVVLAETLAEGTVAGEAVARQVAANHGFPASELTVEFSGDVVRGGAVTAAVGVDVPAVTIPGIAHVGSMTWTTTHTESVDRYRSLP